jgi:hypothetical protein
MVGISSDHDWYFKFPNNEQKIMVSEWKENEIISIWKKEGVFLEKDESLLYNDSLYLAHYPNGNLSLVELPLEERNDNYPLIEQIRTIKELNEISKYHYLIVRYNSSK